MNYQLFAIPLLVMIINQIVKVLLEMRKGKFSWPVILSYGGMPSSHAAVVTSLTYVMGYYQGLQSPSFAISLVMALLILRDATGIRWQLGNNSKVINRLIKELPDDREYAFPVLHERFGHRNIEVFFGIIVGLLGAVLLIKVW
jgi:acid phosphatase family membrane protein YuiD